MRSFQTHILCFALILWGLPAHSWAAKSKKPTTVAKKTSAKPMTPKQAQALAEKILLLSNKKQFKQVLGLMSPLIQKTISVTQLKQQLSMTLSTIGPYKAGTLNLRSQVTQAKHTRFIWQGTFAKEKGTVLLLLDSQQQVAGFIIQSPTLLRKIRQEQPTTLKKAQLAKLAKLVKNLMNGYNAGQWKIFCKDCNSVMKVLLKPPRFQNLIKVFHNRYGKVKRYAFFKASRLALAKILVLRYKGVFSKQVNKPMTIQFAFQQLKGKYLITGWQIKP